MLNFLLIKFDSFLCLSFLSNKNYFGIKSAKNLICLYLLNNNILEISCHTFKIFNTLNNQV